ncbi:TetR/AcrR family transcriptional regulator [Novosphingobium mangrovi (ex Huang et al. 2023)]|uniref:TetR/AcrR family transcriptional regulator n=1 Tax=Novosphingobium mangrovi (ex Huang et al. 2023) TaxID=2976432 RepID=A0ABT2I5V7_9SPHN|nr:TetR/AcrR family transcriptional regulator [Novosphingobium mangrovi (ex Huang et al. 2023)]MCT2400205.1 TetR/AcrR family transcriptional regulator [Novosphingobium mangrovi (ex Huang et al. 2023)]
MTTATAPKRRMGSRSSATHAALLDATEAVMREEGYAAVTSRRVAERAGINQQTVYYYFATMDDLLLAAYGRRTGQMRKRVEQAMAADRPLHALWQCFADPFDAALTMEYLALANHNDAIRRETVAFGERLRALEVDHLVRGARSPLPDGAPDSPLGLVMALTWVTHLMGFEATLGLRGGHREVRQLAEWALRQVEPAGRK